MRIDEIKAGQEYVDLDGLQKWYAPASGMPGFALIGENGRVIAIRGTRWEVEIVRRGLASAECDAMIGGALADLLHRARCGS